jgi:hypothetical protein
MTAEGSVSDFDDAKRTSLESSIAAVAGVDASAVTVAITPGSVIITATIAVPASKTAEAVQNSLATSLGTASAASAALAALSITVLATSLGITESLGQRDRSQPPPSPPPPSPATTPTGGGTGSKATPLAGASGSEMNIDEGGGGPPTAAIGGGAAVAILLMVGLGCYYLRKKRMAGSQSPVALTAISLTPTKEKDLESGSPATKGPAASGKTTTYSVELTKTPMGLGLSLTDDIVTEIKPDSQAARGGRIKEGHRRQTLTLTQTLTLITLILTLTRWVIGLWP